MRPEKDWIFGNRLFDRLATTEEMLSIGLFLSDLNSYDGSSEILISGIQHARQLQKAIEKVRDTISLINKVGYCTQMSTSCFPSRTDRFRL